MIKYHQKRQFSKLARFTKGQSQEASGLGVKINPHISQYFQPLHNFHLHFNQSKAAFNKMQRRRALCKLKQQQKETLAWLFKLIFN